MSIAGTIEKETRVAHLEINGGNKLRGEVTISGSKNASLPIMAACLLVKGPVILHNVPNLDDVRTLKGVLESLGARVSKYDGNTLLIDCTDVASYSPPSEFVSKMRASVLVMGPLLARFGKADIPLPGGCKLGPRPIDIHIDGLGKLGGNFSVTGEIVQVTADGLIGIEIPLRFPSVGATENIMMAACLAEGATTIIGAAKEPEIIALADFLNRRGGKISGAGDEVVTIEGVEKLNPGEDTIIPDRVECGTYLIAGASAAGDIVCRSAEAAHLTALIERLTEAGCEIEGGNGEIRLKAPGRCTAIDVRTLPYPGFSTDMQPQMMALNAGARGAAIIVEKIFQQRFLVKDELIKMGAKIRQVENAALTIGQANLHGADVIATDIRASAALICASLRAEGRTRIHNLEHLFRGYEDPMGKLSGLGADIQLLSE
jgi:UDP-N-acetylglucosamine 1-carboxyvinyltransferase